MKRENPNLRATWGEKVKGEAVKHEARGKREEMRVKGEMNVSIEIIIIYILYSLISLYSPVSLFLPPFLHLYARGGGGEREKCETGLMPKDFVTAKDLS